MSRNLLEAKNKMESVTELFTRRQFLIGRYQRVYSWGKREMTDLWNDLLKLLKNFKIEDFAKRVIPNLKYKIGTITLARNVVEGNEEVKDCQNRAIPSFMIIDGQQRLITLSILLKVLYHELRDIEDEECVSLEKFFWFKGFKKDSRGRNKIEQTLLLRENEVFFRKFMFSVLTKFNGMLGKLEKCCKNKCQSNILQAFTFFRKRLDSFRKDTLERSKKRYKNFVGALKFVICKNLVVHLNFRDPKENVHVLFEALNTRGIQLNEVQKFKSLMFSLNKELDLNIKDNIISCFERFYRNLHFLKSDRKPFTQTEDEVLELMYLVRHPLEKSSGFDSYNGVFDRIRLPLERYEKEIVQRVDNIEYDAKEKITDLCKNYLDDLVSVCEIYTCLHRKEVHAYVRLRRDSRTFVAYMKRLGRIFGEQVGVRKYHGVIEFITACYVAMKKLKCDNATNTRIMLQVIKFMEVFAFRVRAFAKSNSKGVRKLKHLGKKILDINKHKTLRESSVLAKFQEVFDELSVFINQSENIKKSGMKRFFYRKWNHWNWPVLKYFLFEYQHDLYTKKATKLMDRGRRVNSEFGMDVVHWDEFKKKSTPKATYVIGRILPKDWSDPCTFADDDGVDDECEDIAEEYTQIFGSSSKVSEEHSLDYSSHVANYVIVPSDISHELFDSFKVRKEKDFFGMADILILKEIDEFSEWTIKSFTKRKRDLYTFTKERWGTQKFKGSFDRLSLKKLDEDIGINSLYDEGDDDDDGDGDGGDETILDTIVGAQVETRKSERRKKKKKKKKKKKSVIESEEDEEYAWYVDDGNMVDEGDENNDDSDDEDFPSQKKKRKKEKKGSNKTPSEDTDDEDDDDDDDDDENELFSPKKKARSPNKKKKTKKKKVKSSKRDIPDDDQGDYGGSLSD